MLLILHLLKKRQNFRKSFHSWDIGISNLFWFDEVISEFFIEIVRYKNFTIDVRAFCRYTSLYNYTGWLVTGGTSEKGVILREKISRKYRIKIFRLRLCFRENRHWIFARYACTLSRLVITALTVDRCLNGYYRSLSLFLL